MIALTKERKKLMKEFPNLVDYESKQVVPALLRPGADARGDARSINDVKVEKAFLGSASRRRPIQRTFQRSTRRVVGGAPRGAHRHPARSSTSGRLAPFWRTYLETLGLQKQNVVFSDETSEEMWQEGGKYGSIDPCYPSKVAQAHIHNLLFHHHSRRGRQEAQVHLLPVHHPRAAGR